jgi:processive 1,2-diacylglycerol beta-glucosyltransferase
MSTGQGHHATGQAIQDYFEKAGSECRMIDAYGYIRPMLQDAVAKAYMLSTKYTPKASSLLYELVVKKNEPMNKYSLVKLTNTLMASELRDYIDDYKPDIIICTHVLPATMINILIEKDCLNAITVGIVTDFTLHPLWEETRRLDYFVTVNELLEHQLMQKGIDLAKVLPFGIPIKPKFSIKGDQKKAREAFKLDPDTATILLMSGSMGYGKIDKTIERLDELPLDFQTIVVCGHNKRQYRKIKRLKTSKRFDVYGYVDNVDQMMDAADCIITKPGGITSSEALAKELPMIMVNPIPGQEERNAEFMLNNGLALQATKTFPLEEAIFTLFKHPERLKHLKKTIALYGKKQATQKLCDFLTEEVAKRGDRSYESCSDEVGGGLRFLLK